MLGVAVEANPWNAPCKAFQQTIPELAQPLGLSRHLRAGNRGGAAQPDTQRCGQSSRTQPALLSAAVDQRQQPNPRPAPDIERPDPLRPVNFMAGDR